MALSQSMQLEDNFKRMVDFDNVYIKVGYISGDKNKLTAVLEYKTAADGTVLKTHNVLFDLNLNGSNPIQQAYEHLKTLPEFANATDC